MTDALNVIWHGLRDSFLMAWEVWWALVLGFAISAIVQAWVPRERVEAALPGRVPPDRARDRARRGFLVVLVRRDRDRQVAVPEGRLGSDARSRSSSPRPTSCGSSGSCCGC